MAKDKKKAKANKNEDKKNRFWKEYKAELKKVKWPTAKELFNNTVAVIAIVFIVSVIVIVLDLAFEGVNKLEVKGVEKLQNTITVNNSIDSDENSISSNEVTNSDQTKDDSNVVVDNSTETTEAENVAE